MSEENPIEVGSLWVNDFTKSIAKVIFCTEQSIVYKIEKLGKEYFCPVANFIHNYKPHTPPKEYKVILFERNDGTVFPMVSNNDEHKETDKYKIKAILIGKEGDGL